MERASTPRTVLLVDDAVSVREALRWALEESGEFRIVGEAADGSEAVERAAVLTPDIVVLDIELPGQDGYTVARVLKAAPNPPRVVFLTIHTDGASRRKAEVVGSDGYVEKCAGWPALINVLRRLPAER